MSLQNVILSSCFTFDDSIYYRTSDNTFIPISNSEKPVAGNKCYVQTKDIIIHNNPIISHPGEMCSCGKMCKNNRGLEIHQDKTKCQAPENNLVAPPQKCFVSLQNVILSSCLTFDDSIYYRTSDNTFIPISNSEKLLVTSAMYKRKTLLSIL